MKILVIPGCDDTNRGDQALIWETVRIARDAGLHGEYYMISTPENSKQSEMECIHWIPYILPHPSTHFKQLNDNRKYTLSLKIMWGLRAILDIAVAAPLAMKILRPFMTHVASQEKKKTLSLFREADLAIVKGGGFLHAGKGLTETYKIYFFLYHIKLALSMGIPVLIMPNSYGSFGNAIQKKLVRNTLNRCALVTSRESISRDVLRKECSVESLVTMDLGAYLITDKDFDPYAYLESRGIKLSHNKNVVITARPYRFPGCDNPDRLYCNYIDSLAGFIRWLYDNGYNVVLVEHVYSETYHESDIKAIEDIKKALNSDNGIKLNVIADKKLNCKNLKSIYSCFDYMVGTRFHSVIFSLFAGVPSIAITYGGNKGLGIMRDLGIEKYSVAINDISKEKLVEMFSEMKGNRDEYMRMIDEKKRYSEAQRVLLIDKIHKALEN